MTPKAREILDMTARDRSGLLASIDGLNAAQMAYAPSEDVWSIADVLQHLALSHESIAKLFAHFLKRAADEAIPDEPEPGGTASRSLEAVVSGTAERRVTAPERVTPQAFVAPDDSLARLEASRNGLVETVATLSAYDGTTLTYRHAFLGELDVYQWLIFAGWHERRHTRQIERIQAASTFPRSRNT